MNLPAQSKASHRIQRDYNRIQLTFKDRAYLLGILKSTRCGKRMAMRAHILLLADMGHDGPGLSSESIARMLNCAAGTVRRVRSRFRQEGVGSINYHAPRNPKCNRMDEQAFEALLGLIRTKPPVGSGRWTLRTLAQRLVSLELVDRISHETVRRALKTIQNRNPGPTN